MLSYSSTGVELSEKPRFAYFSRVVPPDNLQAKAMAHLVIKIKIIYKKKIIFLRLNNWNGIMYTQLRIRVVTANEEWIVFVQQQLNEVFALTAKFIK